MNIIPPDPRDERTFAIIGAAMEVHRVLGSGFLEVFYRDALAIEFGLRSVPFVTEVPCKIDYKGALLRGHYRMDFICFGAVVVEVKARFATGPAEQAQVLNYLAATGHQCGLLLNFGSSRLEHRRFVLTKPRWPIPGPGNLETGDRQR
ncbi:MAG: hypothetical protein A3J29_18385 [Acidobacteria bacterium RIFCSPLOWO2_12_FULL_67_14b]|nr:MAG: hypothetical protein A3J29_18385 [Acidobacteria bacterium RIFCSPLOWO2_12_FULL_67_14b]